MNFKYVYQVERGQNRTSALVDTNSYPSELELSEFTHYTNSRGSIIFPCEDHNVIYTNYEQ